MSALFGLVFYFLIIWLIVKSANKKNKKTVQRPVSGKVPPVPAVHNAVKRPAPVQNTQPEDDISDPQAYFGEGEDPKEHEAHLMRSAPEGETKEEHTGHLMQGAQEGESDEEHAEHMRASESRSDAEPPKSVSYAAALKADPDSLKRAVVMSEILGKPAALRSPRFGGRQ